MRDQLECEIGSARAGEAVVVTIRGEVDLATAPELELCLQRAFGESADGVVLDLDGLTFIDSSGLRVLVALAKDARSRDASFTLTNVPRHAQRVLDLTGLSEWFDRGPDATG
jgi:anti-sigma B factor antagonist